VAAKLVRDGWALAYIRYTAEYLQQEKHAQAIGAGITFITAFRPGYGAREQMRRQPIFRTMPPLVKTGLTPTQSPPGPVPGLPPGHRHPL
jgi:hypothetical protein